jgi:hypothetical protein
MKLRLSIVMLALGIIVSPVVQAATVTATCKDGTSFSGASRKGACQGHQGVQSWGTTSQPSPAASSTTSPSPAAATTATTATNPPAASTSKKTATANKPQPTAAPGGGPGQVWVNSSSKVYHCAGSKWYGKTKGGKYMSEADAKAQGFHAEHGKVCTS